MDLEKKVNDLKNNLEKGQANKEAREEKMKTLVGYGLRVDKYDALPVPLSDDQKELMREAVGLIKKWDQVKLDFNNVDDVVYETFYREVRTSLKGADRRQFVQYLWGEDGVRCTRLDPAVMNTVGRDMKLVMRRAMKAAETFRVEEEKKRWEVGQHMLKKTGKNDGRQYVILEFDYGAEAVGKKKDIFILFDDGTLYPGPGCRDFIFEGDSMFNKYQGWFVHSREIEDWLAENINRINGIEEEKKEQEATEKAGATEEPKEEK